MPSASITTPIRPLPMKGEGDRLGSDVLSRKLESGRVGPCWAPRASGGRLSIQNTPSMTATTLISHPFSRPAAGLGGPPPVLDQLISNLTLLRPRAAEIVFD